MHRRIAVAGLSVVMLAATSCAGDEDTPVEAGSTSTAPASTAPSSTAGPDATVATPGTTAPRATVPRPTVPRTPDTTAAPIPEPDPGPARMVPLGHAFTIAIGESVGVAGEGLVVTYSQFVSDNRCPIGVQCITAGNAVIVVNVAKAGAAPAGLTLNTTEGPAAGGYLGYTVTLVQLSRTGPSPAASLRVN